VSDFFDTTSGVSVTVADGLSTSVTFAWTSTDCTVRARTTRCRSLVDRQQQARFMQDSTGAIRVRVRMTVPALPNAFAGPGRVTVTQPGPAIDRAGELASCTAAPGKLACRD
jgi:hypothetical protein